MSRNGQAQKSSGKKAKNMADDQHRTKLLKTADVLEARVKKQYQKAVEKAQAQIDLDALALALAKGHPNTVMRLIVFPSLTPLDATLREAYERGGKIGASQINAIR